MNTRPMNIWQCGCRASQEALTRGAHSRAAERTFRQADLPSVRRLAAAFGARTGIGSTRLADFVLAVSEAAACAVAGEPGAARVRLWTTGPRVLCEVRGNRAPRQCPGGPLHGEAEAMRRWLLRQVCDYASVSSAPDGMTVLLWITVT
jgi:serine/threonine-protein kinase RsbW